MKMTKRLGGALAFALAVTAAPVAFAQLDDDPDLMPLTGIEESFEIAVAEVGPMGAEFGAIAVGPMGMGPPGRMGGRCPMGGPGGGPGGPFGFLQGELALTDDQYERLYQLRNDYLNKVGPKMLALKTSEREMRDLMTRPQVDKAKVKALQTTINDNKSALANLRLDQKLGALDVLTEAQRAELRKKLVQGCGPGKFMMRNKVREHFHKG